ncbi:MAG: HNH endonuclease [Anaerolineales bacterium]|nr:HNH endonuclease [Anaerolineales bacterium]
MELPLSITTTPESPYDDAFEQGEILHYRYRGEDPQHRDNVGLRRAMQENRPLVYFFGLVKSQYLAVWPVYIVGDNPAALTFQVVAEDMDRVVLQPEQFLHTAPEDARRQYLTAEVRVRLHQRSFRERVLQAYQSQCALCRLRHRELLDAAHILPDPHPEGWPIVRNGLALCKLHHAAFDSFLLTVTPDYLIHIREDILQEEDGPVLQHALKGLERSRILLPRNQADWPNQEALEWRYAKFQSING